MTKIKSAIVSLLVIALTGLIVGSLMTVLVAIMFK